MNHACCTYVAASGIRGKSAGSSGSCISMGLEESNVRASIVYPNGICRQRHVNALFLIFCRFVKEICKVGAGMCKKRLCLRRLVLGHGKGLEGGLREGGVGGVLATSGPRVEERLHRTGEREKDVEMTCTL